MKRIHLFEFEDFNWFPNWLRKCMTNYIIAFHRVLNSEREIAKLVAKALAHSKEKQILDLCSGSGGPMVKVKELLQKEHGILDVKLILSDLYPNEDAARKINSLNNPRLIYQTEPVNAGKVDPDIQGVRTMICSFHHMKPELAHSILKDAKESHQPICIYEISDNTPPAFLWWLAVPFGFIMTLFFTPLVRPLTFQQIFFTYFIPLIPLFIAWDGAVSNARTYTLNDLEEVLKGLDSADYIWEKGIVKGRFGGKVYLLGLPK
jgi:hypothetical protein